MNNLFLKNDKFSREVNQIYLSITDTETLPAFLETLMLSGKKMFVKE